MNFDTLSHKLVHTWKCHALSISLHDIVPEKCLSCSAGYLCINKYQNNSGKDFFIMYHICEIYHIYPCISQPPFWSPKISFSYFWLRIFLKNIFCLRIIFFQVCYDYMKKICPELFLISVFDPCISRGRYFGPIFRL